MASDWTHPQPSISEDDVFSLTGYIEKEDDYYFYLPQIRCNCGKPTGVHYGRFTNMLREGMLPDDSLNQLGINDVCCRITISSPTVQPVGGYVSDETIDKILGTTSIKARSLKMNNDSSVFLPIITHSDVDINEMMNKVTIKRKEEPVKAQTSIPLTPSFTPSSSPVVTPFQQYLQKQASGPFVPSAAIPTPKVPTVTISNTYGIHRGQETEPKARLPKKPNPLLTVKPVTGAGRIDPRFATLKR